MTEHRRVLAVATNQAPSLGDHRTGLWLSELTHFLEVVTAGGWSYDVVSPAGGEIPLDEESTTKAQLADPANVRAMADASFRAALSGSTACADVDPAAYHAIYLAGGHGTMWDFRQSAALKQLLMRMHSAGAWLTGVCHGISGFVDSRDAQGHLIVAGRRVTGFTNFEDLLAGSKRFMPFLLEEELKRNGAHFKKRLLPFSSHVQVDGRLITGQNPKSARAVGEQLLRVAGDGSRVASAAGRAAHTV